MFSWLKGTSTQNCKPWYLNDTFFNNIYVQQLQAGSTRHIVLLHKI